MPTHRRTRLLALGLATMLVAAACGGSSDSSADDSSGDDPTTTTAPTALTAAAPGEVAEADPVPSGGCGSSVIGTVSDEQTYLDDSDRSFQLWTPPEHDGDTPVPIVFDFHGLAEGANVHTMMTELGEYGAANGFAVVFPQGLGAPARWEIGLTDNSDLDYVDQMLDQIEATTCIDTSRVYATGLSNGAFLSSVLACTRSDRFTAVAPVAGLLHPSDCDPTRPVPVLAFHGTDDEILLFNGGVGDKLGEVLGEAGQDTEVPTEVADADLDGEGYPAAAQAWADQNGCDPEPTDEDLTDTVVDRTWDCPADGPVEFLIVEGGGHTWPGSEFSQNLVEVMGTTDTSIDANELIWAFFQRFALPQT